MSTDVSCLPNEMEDDIEAILSYTVSSEEAKTAIENFEKMSREGNVDTETKFQYIWCLIHSGHKRDLTKASVLLEELFKEETEEIKRDALFYLAITETKLKHFCTAKRFTDAFLSVEPSNFQAAQLSRYIESQLEKDGVTGMALLGGAALLGGVTAIVVGTLSLGIAFGIKMLGRRSR